MSAIGESKNETFLESSRIESETKNNNINQSTLAPYKYSPPYFGTGLISP